jgi:hypothetical protein
MLVESIICRPTPSYPYHIAAKRYFVHHDKGSVEQLYDEHNTDLTLVFLHSMGFPKEMWEPIIEDLLQGHDRWGTRIREAYAIDCPNHGMAAVLNDGLLGDYAGMVKFSSVQAFTLRTPFLITAFFFQPEQSYLPNARCSSCSAVRHFTRLWTFQNGIWSGLGIPSGASLCNNLSPLLATISEGLTSLSGARVLMQALASPIKFKSIILVEPILVAHQGSEYERLRARLVRFAHKRKDVWNDRKEAAAYFRNTAGWHPRILEIFIVSVLELRR